MTSRAHLVALLTGLVALAARAGQIPNETPVIITGDFNAKAERSRPWDTLVGAGFADAWVQVTPG